MIPLAQITSGGTQARTGSEIARWADTPEKTAVVWVGGIIVLIVVVVALVKLRDLKR